VVVGVVSLAGFGLETVSAARAYVGGEGLWSKAQKDAVFHLQRYARTGREADWDAYREAIAVPLGDRRARLELERPDPDWDAVYEGFLAGGNHPRDIEGLANLYRRFAWAPYMRDAIAIWRDADAYIARLTAAAESLRVELQGARDPDRVAAWLAEVDRINTALRPLEDRFSLVLGAGARWIKRTLLLSLIGTAVLLVGTGGWLSWRLAARARESEAALRESEARYRALVEDATHGIARVASTGEIEAANPALARLLGYQSPDELRGFNLWREACTDPAGGASPLAEFAGSGHFDGVEQVWKRRDGRPLRIRMSGRWVPGPGGEPDSLHLVVEDVTQQRVLEEQLRQAQKMEAVGRLTGGIAHDLNNLLTAILGNAELLATQMPPDQPLLHGDLDDLRQAARRAAEMVRKLLAFARRETLTLQRVEARRVVSETIGILRHLLPATIEVRLEGGEGGESLHADPVAVQQILLNLATNARDAMPRGGSLTFRIAQTQVKERAAENRTHPWLAPGRYVTITVQDTGSGMDAETRARVFEPFFTTKPPGQGTGLGLAMVYGLMKQHRGFVEVESTPGRGTTFTLYFPPAPETIPAASEPPAPGVDRGRGTVLVVEDEDAVRRTACRTLERAGFTVVPAGDGVEALELLRHRGEEIHLVLTDVVMPRMGGIELHERAREAGWHSLPFLFTSGYPLSREGATGGDLTGFRFLRKPWTPAELVRRVSEALSRSPPGESAIGES
jgi:PAS domain S-box-containing protein